MNDFSRLIYVVLQFYFVVVYLDLVALFWLHVQSSVHEPSDGYVIAHMLIIMCCHNREVLLYVKPRVHYSNKNCFMAVF